MTDPTDLRDVFDRAATLPAQDRSAFLAQACGDNVALRQEVERLLAADARAGSVFDSTPAQANAAHLPSEGSRRSLPSGTRLGPYQIGDPLGAGGMGEVYKARDTRLDRTVAVKVLPAELTRDPTARLRFEREARAAAALTHPHICTLLDVGRHDDRDFLVMEYVEGETLAHRLAHQKLALPTALTYAVQVADAIAAAHHAGIVHRDIKPENVMLRPDGFVKVLDFGVAKLVPHGPDHPGGGTTQVTYTDRGMVVGTVAYMSPEQARGQAVDARTDVWSLGCVLYEMIAGRSPFAAASRSDVIVALLQNEPPPLARFDPAVPTELERIVSKALRKDRPERYQTMDDLMLDLRALRESLPGQGKRSGPEAAVTPPPAAGGGAMTPSPTPHPSSAEYVIGSLLRHRLPTSAVVLVAAAALAGTWWIGHRLEGNGPTVLPAVEHKLTRLTFGSGLQTDPTFSPDGRFIAYASDKAGRFDVWVQPIAGGEAVQITHTPAQDTEPAWSPDGSTIAFSSDRGGGGIFVVSALGGSERRVTNFGRYPSWSSDGSQIRFLAGALIDSVWVDGIYGVSLNGDPPRQLLPEFTASGRWRWIASHPDGRISFQGGRRGADPTFNAFYTVSSNGTFIKSEKKSGSELFALGANADNDRQRFQWSPDGSALYVQSIAGRVRNLWKVSVDPTTLAWTAVERLTTGPGADVNASVSRDGREMAFATLHESERLWAFPFDPERRHVGEGRPFSEEGAFAGQSALSPDGRTVAFNLGRLGGATNSLWLSDLDTGKAKLVSNDAGSPVWSRDGRRLLYQRWRPDLPHGDFPATALVVRESDGTERLVTPWETRRMLVPGDWTPDGERLLMIEMLNDVPSRLLLWSLSGKPQDSQLFMARDGVSFWQTSYSPNGRWLTFVAQRRDGVTLGVTAANGGHEGDWLRLVPDHPAPDKPRWSPDGRRLYFLSSKGGRFLNLWAVQFDPDRGVPIGEPFRISHWDSPGLIISPNIAYMELGVSATRIVATMRTASGNIWMLDHVDR